MNYYCPKHFFVFLLNIWILDVISYFSPYRDPIFIHILSSLSFLLANWPDFSKVISFLQHIVKCSEKQTAHMRVLALSHQFP